MSGVPAIHGHMLNLSAGVAFVLMGVMLISIAITLMLVLWQQRVVKRSGSKGVAADSLHYVADLIPNIGGAAFDALMDRSASPETMEKLAGIIANWPGLYGYHDLKTRTAGTALFVQVHIELDGGQGLRAAYNISKALKRGILVAYPQADVIIHKDLARKTDDI